MTVVTEAVVKEFLNNYFVLKSLFCLEKDVKEKMRATDIVTDGETLKKVNYFVCNLLYCP